MMSSDKKVVDTTRLLTKGREGDFAFVLKTAFLKDANDKWRNSFSLLKLIKKGSKELDAYKLDYGNFILEKSYLSLDKGLSFCERLEEGQLNINGYVPKSISTQGNSLMF